MNQESLENIFLPSPLTKIKLKSHPDFDIYIKREDLIHPSLSGNKFRKLKYNLQEFMRSTKTEIISFGGAYSNHIHAMAFACFQEKIPLRLFIRGEKVVNPTISDVQKWDAKLTFIDRSTYRQRNSRDFLKNLHSSFPNAMIIPEGGTNQFALKGIAEMMEEIYTVLKIDSGIQFCVSYGSGGTAIGMLNSLREQDQLFIFPAIKLKDFQTEIQQKKDNLGIVNKKEKIVKDFHFGGYAKFSAELIQFINHIKEQYEIPLEPIYTGKLFYGVLQSLNRGLFSHKKPIVIIHSGGLQGIRGFNERFGNLIH